MMMRRLVVLTLLVLLAGHRSASAAEDFKTPGKDWAKGPVRWLMTEEEEKEFKKIKTDDERQSFAKSFWEKRDPTPGTPENEFETIFWKRVESADKSYTVGALNKPGSITEMGRVFVMLGPPTSTSRDSRYSYWVYEPSPLNGLVEKLEFKFSPQQTGPLLLDRKEFERYVAAHPETRGVGWKIPVVAQAAPSGELPEAPSQQEKEDLSPESQRQVPILEAILAKGSGPTEVPFSLWHDFYAAADGSTLMVLTVESPRAAAHGSDASLHPFARLAPASGEGKPVNLTGDLPFVPAPQSVAPPGSYVYQARRNLKPGAYKLASVVEDKMIAGQMGALVQTVTVPDFSDKHFDMSSISLLAGFSPIEASVGPDDQPRGPAPYILGGFRLVPRAVHVLMKTEALSFYFQVYNPAPDPASGKPSLEATYAFFLKEGEGWKPFRRPLVKPLGQVELFSIDLKDLLRPEPILPADFKMQVKITDKVSGKTLEREVDFTVR